MTTYKIAVLSGDGVGPEVTAQAVRVLQVAAEAYNISLHLSEGLIGQAALDAGGKVLPPETLRLCKDADAVLLGPVGGSSWEDSSDVNHPKQGVIKLRSWLNTFATLRPIRLHPCLADTSPLRAEQRAIDVLVVYDHSSGLYYGTPRGIETTDRGRTAVNTQVYSTEEISRTARLAFAAAGTRNQRLICIDQSKYLETGVLWRDTVTELALEYPEIAFRRQDAAYFLHRFVGHSRDYCTILTEMSLGHQISSVASGLTGNFILHPAAFLGGDVPLFQPAHGAATELAGLNQANPLGAIMAVSMLLDHALDCNAGALAVTTAIDRVLEEGLAAPEPGSKQRHPHSTTETGDAVLAALRSLVPARRAVG